MPEHIIRGHDRRLLPPDPPEVHRIEVTNIARPTLPRDDVPEFADRAAARNIILWHIAEGYIRGDDSDRVARCIAVDLDVDLNRGLLDELYTLWPDRGLFNNPADVVVFDDILDVVLDIAGFTKETNHA